MMKYYFSILILCLHFCTTIFANEEIESKELYLEYSSHPQRVFTGQTFNVQLKALILKDETTYDNIITTFTPEENVVVLTQDVQWVKNKLSEYTTTLTYKVLTGAFTLPKITLALSKDEEIIDFISINSPAIEYEKIAVNQKLFSNVIGNELEILTVKTKQYTNNILHTTINIRAKNSNLEDFKLQQYMGEQGINSLTNDYPIQNLFYYVMIPSHTKKISFDYYNSDTKNFIRIHIPIILDKELVSTQTELNPYNSSLLLYKQIGSGIILLLFIGLYAFKRNNFYLVLVILAIGLLAYLFMPNKKMIIDRGLQVYILPTKNSTVFKTLEKKEVVEIINENDEFIKILFPNENIGWIKK